MVCILLCRSGHGLGLVVNGVGCWADCVVDGGRLSGSRQQLSFARLGSAQLGPVQLGSAQRARSHARSLARMHARKAVGMAELARFSSDRSTKAWSVYIAHEPAYAINSSILYSHAFMCSDCWVDAAASVALHSAGAPGGRAFAVAPSGLRGPSAVPCHAT